MSMVTRKRLTREIFSSEESCKKEKEDRKANYVEGKERINKKNHRRHGGEETEGDEEGSVRGLNSKKWRSEDRD